MGAQQAQSIKQLLEQSSSKILIVTDKRTGSTMWLYTDKASPFFNLDNYNQEEERWVLLSTFG